MRNNWHACFNLNVGEKMCNKYQQQRTCLTNTVVAYKNYLDVPIHGMYPSKAIFDAGLWDSDTKNAVQIPRLIQMCPPPTRFERCCQGPISQTKGQGSKGKFPIYLFPKRAQELKSIKNLEGLKRKCQLKQYKGTFRPPFAAWQQDR